MGHGMVGGNVSYVIPHPHITPMSSLTQLLDTENECMRNTYGFAEAESIVNARGCPLHFDTETNVHQYIRSEVHRIAGIPPRKETSATAVDVTTLKGYHVYKQMMDVFDLFKFERVSFQEKFVQRTFNAMLPLIFAEDGEWNLYQTAIREFYEVRTHRSILAIACGRQMGKTTIVSAILAATALFCRGLNVMVIRLGERQSMVLKNAWMNAINAVEVEYGKGYILRDNSETSIVSRSRGKTPGDSNQFKFIPSTSRGGRGQQAHLVVIDEAAFIKPSVYAELLLPLMGVDGCVTVLMSTPPKEAGFFTELLVKRDSITNEPIADVLKVELACEICRARKLATCPHTEFETPSWQANSTKKRQISELYDGNANDRDRELSGVVVMDSAPAFRPELIDALLTPRAIYNFRTSPPDALVLSIDPSGGGPSHAGISVIGVCYDPSPSIVVVGGASIDMSKADNTVLYHGLAVLIHGLRLDPRFSKCMIAVCIEGNLSQVSAIDIANAVAKLDRNIVIMSETHRNGGRQLVNGPYVILNPHDGKERYVAITGFFLRTFRFRFCDRLYTDKEGISHGEQFKQILIRQLRQFLVETKKGADNGVHTPIRRTYSGKGSGGNDDACMALMMAIHQACIFFSSRAYSDLRGAKPRVLTYADDAVDRDYARLITESIRADNDSTSEGSVKRLPWNASSEHARGRG